MIVHTNNGEVFQVCQTDEGEQIWNEDATEFLVEGDFIEVSDGIIDCIKGDESIFSRGIKAGECK